MHSFRVELAKFFAIIAICLVLLSGIVAKVSAMTLLVRILIGGAIFTTIGFLFGAAIDQQKTAVMVNQEKEKIKTRMRANYDSTINTVTKSNVTADDFSPLEVDRLTKIIVDSMEE